MLQRAASNAFSWWWASHIRTKQSKWLEQSLIDMEDKVQNALNIIQKDGDSFGKRAEMYYRHRPDLISFVEETFRAYRSLAERYDKLSRDLQKANTTIASIFPDQVSYEDFDDDFCPPKIPKNMPPQNDAPCPANIPKVPQLPSKNLKGLISHASKKMQVSKTIKETIPTRVVLKSGLSEEQALDEIDKIQNEILAMQTMKEFTKSAYENGISKYWEIENKIKTMQQRVCKLQDEFKVGKVIEDGDARTVMAQAALTSCKDTLDKLEEKRENSSVAARSEHEKIINAKLKFNKLKQKVLLEQVNDPKMDGENESQILNQDTENEELEKIKRSLEEKSRKPLTVSKMADTIDKLSNKVIRLESTVSSQTAHIDRLRSQTGELQTLIQTLESDKASLADKDRMRKKLKEVDKKLFGVVELEKDVEKRNCKLKLYFSESRCKIDHLSEKLQDVQPDEETEMYSPMSEEDYFGQEDGNEEVFCNFGEERTLNSYDEVVVEDSEIPCTSDNDAVMNKKKRLKKKVIYNKRKGQIDDDGVKNENTTKEKGNINNDGVKNENTTKEKGEIYDDGVKNENMAKEKGEIYDDGVKNESTTKEKGEIYDDGEKNANTTKEKSEVNDDGVKIVDIGKDEANLKNINIHKNDCAMNNTDTILETGHNERQNIEEFDDKSQKNPIKRYTKNFKNYKETKEKLSEEEKKKLGTLFELIVQVRELKTCIVKRDNEIQNLKQKLNQLHDEEKWEDVKQDDISLEERYDEDINISIDDPEPVSEIEEKFRTDIDAILDENLDFWLRFSTQFHQVQKFKTEVEDLHEEIVKVKAKGAEAKSEEKPTSSMFTTDLRSSIRPIYKHLKEIQGELTLWLEEAKELKDELHSRCSSLSNIKEEITLALKEGMLEDEIKFSTHHAAKFQGEILNMEQENNRVNEELKAAFDHVRALHVETKKTLRKLEEEFGLSDNQSQQSSVQSPTNRPGIPLRSFIFGVKAKKQKPSIFTYVNNKKPRGSRT